ncbi:HGGxSTG domain-containing protein [Sphingomonas sp.]|uniref:HGGxSTG domain-containing protein n=1 Tax=Sphingomonas sp. TaxID=28214 RepID=UPI0037521F5D
MDGPPPLLTNAPLCQARNRAGASCRCPAVRGKRVCRVHGGLSPGAPIGERNGQWRHGGWSNETVALRREVSALIKEVRDLL